MKKKFLEFMKKEIKKQNPSYTNDKMDEIMYGIEGLYLTVTKMVIIFALALLLGIFKELIFLLITYNFVRLFAFGLHASKSWHCLVFSSLIFLLGAYLCKVVTFEKNMLFILYFVSFVLFAIFAPADTKKRPLIKKNKRIIYKVLSLLVIIVYFAISTLMNNSMLSNYLIIGILIEGILILPLTYKVFKMPYNNYKNYGLNVK